MNLLKVDTGEIPRTTNEPSRQDTLFSRRWRRIYFMVASEYSARRSVVGVTVREILAATASVFFISPAAYGCLELINLGAAFATAVIFAIAAGAPVWPGPFREDMDKARLAHQ